MDKIFAKLQHSKHIQKSENLEIRANIMYKKCDTFTGNSTKVNILLNMIIRNVDKNLQPTLNKKCLRQIYIYIIIYIFIYFFSDSWENESLAHIRKQTKNIKKL